MSEEVQPSAARGSDAQVVRRAGVVAAFTLLSRIAGYARDAVLANVFGASAVFDAFVVAQTIPNLLRRLVAEGALVIAYVPLLAEEKNKGGPAAMSRFSGGVLGLLLPVLAIAVGAGMLFPRPLVDLFAPGFEADSAALAARLTAVMMPYMAFVSLVALAGGALNVEGSFGPAAAAPILLNAAVITAALFFRDRFDDPIEAAAWGVTAGGVLQLLLQIPFLARHRLLVAPRWAPRDPAVATLLRRMGPAVFGVAVYQINVVVIRMIGSFLPAGQLSCYYNATRLQEFALGVFAVSVSVAALPTLSEHAARRDWDQLLATFRRALRVTNFVTVPATVMVLALSLPMVGVLFRHGNYTVEAAQITATVLVILGLALVPIGAVRVAVPTFYALGDTRTPVVGATASLFATFAIGFLLRERFEIYGLTLATSAAAVVQLVVLWRALRRAIATRRRLEPPPPDLPPAVGAMPESVLLHALRCSAAALPGGLLSFVAARWIDWHHASKLGGGLALMVLFGGAALTYILLAKLLKIHEVDLVLGAVRRRLGRFTR